MCNQWVHLSCSTLKKLEFVALTQSKMSFYYLPCYKSIFPFQCLYNQEFRRKIIVYSKYESKKPFKNLSDINKKKKKHTHKFGRIQALIH